MNRLGYKTEAYNIRQIPALYIYSNRTRIATGIERPSLQMCQGLSHIVLSVNTGRVNGLLPATYCRGRKQLVNREVLYRQNLSGQGACSSGKNAGQPV